MLAACNHCQQNYKGRIIQSLNCNTVLLKKRMFSTFHHSGDSSVVIERRTRDRKVAGSSPCRSGGRIFRSFCLKCRLQLNTRAPYYAALHEVTWRMVAWCIQNAPRRQKFHAAPTMPAVSKPLRWIFNNAL